MKRAPIALLGITLVVALGIVALGRLDAVASDRLYTVAEVQAGLRQDPRAWAGHTIQLTGAVMMQTAGGCPPSAPACTPPAWVYVGSEGTPRWSPLRRVMVLEAFAQQQLLWFGSKQGFPPPRIPGTERALLLKVPSGTFVSAQTRRPLPDALYDLPLVGEPLSRLFPWRTQLIITVRLNSPGACARGSQSHTFACPDGVVLSS